MHSSQEKDEKPTARCMAVNETIQVNFSPFLVEPLYCPQFALAIFALLQNTLEPQFSSPVQLVIATLESNTLMSVNLLSRF